MILGLMSKIIPFGIILNGIINLCWLISFLSFYSADFVLEPLS